MYLEEISWYSLVYVHNCAYSNLNSKWGLINIRLNRDFETTLDKNLRLRACNPASLELKAKRKIKWIMTELGPAGRESIWLPVVKHRPRCVRSVRHDRLEPNIFPSSPPSQSISTYMYHHMARKSECFHWFLLGSHFTVWTVSSDMVIRWVFA